MVSQGFPTAGGCGLNVLANRLIHDTILVPGARANPQKNGLVGDVYDVCGGN